MPIPSTTNCTPATPTVSAAFADTVTFAPDTIAPFAGAVIVTVGKVVSRTVTVNDASIELPRVSLAEQFTVVVPSGNIEPLTGTQLGATAPSTTSTADAA